MKVIKFTACSHLDFSDNYAAKKNLISINGETKVCWNRPVLDPHDPSLVQFCKLRGRMNSPGECLCEISKGCSDYKEIQHNVDLTTVDR